jgi:hypothetical protein
MLLGLLSYNVFGLIFSHLGLKYTLQIDKCQTKKNIFLSRDIEDILLFLNLNYDKWLTGFKDIEDMYLWLSSSKFFNPSLFSLDKMNHTNKTRNRKRLTYQKFSELCDDSNKVEKWPFTLVLLKIAKHKPIFFTQFALFIYISCKK